MIPISLPLERTTLALLVSVALTALAPAATAQDTSTTDPGDVVEKKTTESVPLGRDASELRDHVTATPIDRSNPAPDGTWSRGTLDRPRSRGA